MTLYTAAGAQATLKADSDSGTAVTSLVWNGMEYIDTTNIGRLLQTAYNISTYDQGYNPTEGGGTAGLSQINGAWQTAPWAFSTSVHPAYWNPLPDGTKISPDTINKDIFADYAGIVNCFKHNVAVTFTMNYPNPAISNPPYIEIEGLAGYVVGPLNQVYAYDYPTASFLHIASPGTIYDSPTPLIVATADASHAFGMFSKTGSYYAMPNVEGQGVNKIEAALQRQYLYGTGTYWWTVYYIVGTLSDVQTKLKWLMPIA